MASDAELILQEAVELLKLGYPVILTDEFKNPGIPGVGQRWPNFKWTAVKFADFLRQRPNLQLGLLLGDYLDVEIDAPDEQYRKEANEQYEAIVGDIHTVAWSSRRGVHRLFKFSPQQKELLITRNAPASKKVGKLEFRMGVNGAAQSLIPPSETDGFARRWLIDPHIGRPLTCPDGLFDLILDNIQVQHASDDTDDSAKLDRPGDIFNSSANWEDILCPFGWTAASGSKDNEHGVRHWIRPGKTEGIGATTGFCKTDNRPDCFYSFSDSPEIAPLEPRKSYSKFEAYAILNFDGDFRAATNELVSLGYCKEASEQFDGSEFGPLEVPASTSDITVVPPKPPRPPVVPAPIPDFIFDNAIGRYVLANDPHTESDKLGVLMQSWELFGTWIGRGAQFKINNTSHYPNDFLLVVGETADARKGTSLTDALTPYKKGSGELPEFAERCFLHGLGSGEGLLKMVSDSNPSNDGRVIIMVEELAGLMSKIHRQESTLSANLRKAYDGGTMENVTKDSNLRSTRAHVSLIGHVTLEEFRSIVKPEDIFNGLMNRMQFVVVKREKRLADPGFVDPAAIEALSRELNACRDWVEADTIGVGRTFYWSQDAKPVWKEFYESDHNDGKMRTEFGGIASSDSATARHHVHVLRSAMRHAALDRTESISLCHLQSALALCELSRRSTLTVLGGNVDDDAEKILHLLRDDGHKSRTEIFKIFNNRINASRLSEVISFLEDGNHIERGTVKRGKRSVTVWKAR